MVTPELSKFHSPKPRMQLIALAGCLGPSSPPSKFLTTPEPMRADVNFANTNITLVVYFVTNINLEGPFIRLAS